jgi:hypothetical protein
MPLPPSAPSIPPARGVDTSMGAHDASFSLIVLVLASVLLLPLGFR